MHSSKQSLQDFKLLNFIISCLIVFAGEVTFTFYPRDAMLARVITFTFTFYVQYFLLFTQVTFWELLLLCNGVSFWPVTCTFYKVLKLVTFYSTAVLFMYSCLYIMFSFGYQYILYDTVDSKMHVFIIKLIILSIAVPVKLSHLIVYCVIRSASI